MHLYTVALFTFQIIKTESLKKPKGSGISVTPETGSFFLYHLQTFDYSQNIK